MKIHQVGGINYDSNIFLVEAERTILIDAGTGMHGAQVLKAIEAIVPPDSIERIILTHNHPDHSFGVNQLQEVTGADIAIHRDDAAALKTGDGSRESFFGLAQEPVTLAQEFVGGESIELGEAHFEVIHTPGHTRGSIVLYDKDNGILFSGDTIFANGDFGRVDLPGGNGADMRASLEKAVLLGARTLYPGHGPSVEGDAAAHIERSARAAKSMF